jgi:hypothetical protein
MIKTFQDAQDVLKRELQQTFTKMAKNPGKRYYLYYMPATACHDGGLSIRTTSPPNSDVLLASDIRVSGFKTIGQNMAMFHDVLSRLPILSSL